MKCTDGREIKVMNSFAGHYIGTSDTQFGGPGCRISEEYYKSKEAATTALDNKTFTQRRCVENDFCHHGRGCL